jgi:membrane fusion protein (multidrug efflux system)
VVLNTVSNVETVQVRFFLTEDEYIFLTRYFDIEVLDKPETERERRDNLTLVLSDGSVHPYRGSVDFIDRSIDPRTGSILLQATFPNPKRSLRPGQFARVLLEFMVVEDALLVPQRCITELQGQQSVYVLKDDNTVEYRDIEATATKDGLWLVRTGLEPGETVVMEGLQKIRSGMTVHPVEGEFDIPSGEEFTEATQN